VLRFLQLWAAFVCGHIKLHRLWPLIAADQYIPDQAKMSAMQEEELLFQKKGGSFAAGESLDICKEAASSENESVEIGELLGIVRIATKRLYVYREQARQKEDI
jgi:hypothetical protein